ncbi:class I SAM-dependent methyltransferase [Mucilaginibacter sp. E4BP6]|uniref:class I SAM-dependent methyltransferase n=1 Tax=Mucilaginibacter sp. E4BP6 TaxID=2723089 RepID=UPI0015CE3FE0|nr:class I SAM-dependent methyltransferase [Mucilaginibacter sp. E4BP6]NYE65545.1 SAM-dependent methyltransferase [Mucilaginibacter sp. E4BP6]
MAAPKIAQGKPTNEENYTDGLLYRQSAWWKKFFNVQYPYKYNIQRLKPGFVLDIGCGIGRNLLHLNGNGVGVDHNPTSIEVSKSRGLKAYTVGDFLKSSYNRPETFDSILLAHVAEHMTGDDVTKLLKQYLHLLKNDGRIIVITPQEKGFKSDDTHVQFMDFVTVKNLLKQINVNITRQYSFPFPRIIGHFFKFNEFISVAKK